jgi:hypothetical protein
MSDWLAQYYRDISAAEALNEALAEWQAATGAKRNACRRYAERLLMRMQRQKHESRVRLHRLAQAARERRAA